ncbi:MAG: SDR family oxidoreductase [Sulfurospirillum sp.]|nr:SDR family oxidoreductase [Sulfurospirillum sp.]MBL0703463.1 SDR family oxidoreductase [Sulfurospirillum sp.]
MKIALVTGASSGIGQAICNTLRKNGYKVYGISRNRSDIICDLRDTKSLNIKIKEFLKNSDVNLLVNCAGIGIFTQHEDLKIEQIETLIDVNLKAPIILTNLCLKSLKKTKGHIINVSSIEATRHSKFSALYTATKSGLRDFSLTLFEELRKAEVKITNINPDITKTPFFDKLNFEPSKKENTHLNPEDIAKTVLHVIQSPFAVTDITVRAKKFEIVKKR